MNVITAIFGVILRLVAGVKRLLCFLHIVRHRKNSGSILPLHADVKTLGVGEIQTSLPSNDQVELQSWDTWDVDDRPDVSRRAQNNSGYHGNNYQNKKFIPEPEPEKDYFQELQLEPSIRKTKKVLIRKKDEQYPSGGGLSSRLAMAGDIPLSGNELGTLDDQETAWSREALEDLSGEAESAIREKRRNEREQKLAEHQMKKLEKEASKGMKKDKLTAVKMS